MYREIYLTQTEDERKRKVPIIAMTANAFTEVTFNIFWQPV